MHRTDNDGLMVWHDLEHLIGILRRMAHLDQASAPGSHRGASRS